MASILARYVFGQALRGVLLALSVVLVLILLVDFVEQTRTVGSDADGLNLFDFAGLTLLKTPMLIESTLPFILLFGVMMAMFRLNRRSELIVMRASGVSAWRFIAPTMVIALVIGILSPTVLNPFATNMEQQFDQRRATLTGGSVDDGEGVTWLREVGETEQRMIKAQAVDPAKLTLRDATFVIYAPQPEGQPRFARRIDADAARLDGDVWRIENAVATSPGSIADSLGDIELPAYLDAGAFAQEGRASTLSFWELPGAASAAEAVGVSPVPYQLRWRRLATTPALYLAMTLIAAGASLRLMRLGGALQLVVLAGAAGFLLYFVGDMLAAFALNGRLPPILAAIAAPIGAVLIALTVIGHMEDA